MVLILFLGITAAVGILAYIAGRRASRLEAAPPAVTPDLPKIAHKIAHDIKSPLTAMRILLSSTGLKEDERKMLRMSIDRLAELASSIVEDYAVRGAVAGQGDASAVSTVDRDIQIRPLAAVVHSVAVSANPGKLQFEIDARNLGLMSYMQEPEFRKMLAGLMRDADSLTLSTEGDFAVLEVRHASRSPNEAVQKHAKETIDILGGEMRTAGLTTTLRIPAEPVPAWLCTRIQIPHGAEVYALDDDRTFHEVWRRRLPGAKLRSFHSYEEFKKALESAAPGQRFFLIDHELEGETITGVEIIARHGLSRQAILVSGIAYNSKFIQRLEKEGIRFLPKDFVSAVEISLG